MKRHLFYKTFGSYLIIIALMFLVLNLFLRDEVRRVMTGQIEEQLMTYAQLIDLKTFADISRQLNQVTKISGARVTLVDVKGDVFADSEKNIAEMENHIDRPEIQEARVRGKGKSVRFSKSVGVDMLYVAVSITEGSAIKGYIRLARPLHDVQDAVEKTYNSIFLALLVVAFCSLIIAVVFSWRLAAPIRKMEMFTEGLRRGTMEGSVLIKTSDETKKLADNINYLVDELKSKIRQANEENSKLVTAFASMTEGVLILDADDKIEAVNRALSNMLASRYEDITGKTLLEAFRNVELQQAFMNFKQTGQSVSREVALGDTEPVILNVSISGVKGNFSNNKTMVVFHDITRLKKLERVRIDFVANVTHEIRTPLTAILGYLETIRDGSVEKPEEVKKFVDIILKHAQRLNRLVEDLLTISRIELGEVKFHFEDVLPADVISNVMTVIDQKAKLKKIEIINLLPEKYPVIKADKDRLTQIFVNILDNAVKFTPEGGKVSVSAEETGEYTIINVTDTGIGIPKEEVERLGERFYRVDKTRSRELGGTGLGLSIVKHLMIAHGGKMEIESQFGRGTKVSLRFPAKK